MAMRPVTNITVLECWKRIHFALWRVQKGVMNLNGNLWEDRFDDVVDQLQHGIDISYLNFTIVIYLNKEICQTFYLIFLLEICWAITSSELVSVIRSIMGLDTERVNYSAQYLVDFTRPHLRLREREGHYCYTCHVEEALKYVETHGIETQNIRPLQCKANVQEKSSSARLGYIGNVVKVRGLEAALEVVERHPVATSIPIFEPEYSLIGEKIYRGPTSRLSKYKSMHAGNITGGGVTDDGEKFIWFRSSHGKELGRFGYLKVSVEMMGCCLTRNEHDDFIEHPFPLVSQFVYPEMLSQAEEDGKRRRREEEFRAKKRQKI
ncbi:unnamed protein product [Thlaspi arvense]|uniref:Peptidase C1A papain C-terminal domain-containing protein n=1 Tax=Thlaspi arvense TaxID=13288 RepID=A0AAU9SJ38_THLAR|nr:unnamed protein product [Thlaspi arvense]